MNKNELVSVIMPAYNGEKYILKSIQSVISQTYTEWELIVIDDCSNDSTLDIVSKLSENDSRIHYYKNDKNIGVSKTRNRGIELAQGKYVALLDSDDIWYNTKLEKQIKLAKETNADVVYTSYSLVDAATGEKKRDYIVPEETSYNQMLRENVVGCSTVLMLKSVAESHGFDSGFYHEDYVLWLNLIKDNYKFAGSSEVLVDYMMVSSSRSANKLYSAKMRWDIYRNSQKLSVFKSIIVFVSYIINGIKKYRK